MKVGLRQCIDNLKHDARMTDINLKASILTQADIKKHLDSLPDLESQTLKMDLDNQDDADGADDLFGKQDIN